MENSQERRAARRIIVGPEHTIRFSVKGHSFRNVRITNISLTGCFAMVNQRDSALFAQGSLLEQFAFEHPDLAQVGPVTAKVMYVLGGASDQSTLDFMGVGIHFLDMNANSSQVLDRVLETILRT
jgi:hypothetical protein